MKRALLVLSGLVLALFLAERFLAGRETRARSEGRRVGTLFTRAEAENLRKQPALRVEASGESHSFGRVEGLWRCLSYHSAPADGRALQALLDAIAGAEGIVHTTDSAAAAQYGINVPTTLRVSIQGPRAQQDPGGDVLATLEIGTAEGAREGCFVRKKGTREIWSIAENLRAPLEARIAPGLPPLLAPSAVPTTWLEGGELARLTLVHGSETVRVERRERELTPEAAQPGMRPWKWVAIDAAGAETEIGEGYPSFLLRLPYVDVLDAASRAERGLDAPVATLTLESRSGAPLRLAFDAADAGGRVALWVAASEALYLVDPEVFRLAVPDAPLLATPPGDEDPWSRALRALGQ